MNCNTILNSDNISGMNQIKDNTVHVTITSPPFNKKGLYGKIVKGNQIWKKHEIDYDVYDDDMPEEEYIKLQRKTLEEIYRITKNGGSLFYHHKNRRYKNKCHTPFHLYENTSWNLYQIIFIDRRNSPNIRNDILMPVGEYVFWLTKNKPNKVYRDRLDSEFISEFWKIPPLKQVDGHPAPFHPQIPKNCILLTTDKNDIVFDPYMGIGTTAYEAKNLNRKWLGFELSPNYFNTCIKKGLVDERLRTSRRNPRTYSSGRPRGTT